MAARLIGLISSINTLGQGAGGSRAAANILRADRQTLQLLRWVTCILVVGWLVLVAALAWWVSGRVANSWVNELSASSAHEAQATARVIDRLFTEMSSVANMVAHQSQVVQVATRYRIDPPHMASLTREQRAKIFTSDPLVGKVGRFMADLSADLNYARIYLNNWSDDTVAASNWDQPDTIVGMIYSGRTYLNDAKKQGKGHSFGIARLNRSPSYFVSSRIDGANDSPLGVVTVKFDAPDLATFLNGRHIALIVDARGRITTSSLPAFMLRNIAPLLDIHDVARPEDGESLGESLDVRFHSDMHTGVHWLVEGKPYLVHSYPLSHTQYRLVTLASLEPLSDVRRTHFLLALLAATVGTSMILLTSHIAGQMIARRQAERHEAFRTSILNENLSLALAESQKKERQKVEVLGYIGHDLRAPLASIRGYSHILMEEANESQSKLLLNIQRSVKYQSDLIDELLGYAKSELQPLAVQPNAVCLHSLMENISEYALGLSAQRNNRFRYDPPEAMPSVVILDEKRLQQVLLNLLANAAKFTQDGVITLSLTAEPHGAGCTLNFKISDTGVGIDLLGGVDIFAAFQRIQSENGGAGLGLFIAQRIVEAMGGKLSVESVPGEGSTFTVTQTVQVIGAAGVKWPSVAQWTGCVVPLAHDLLQEGMVSHSALSELVEMARHGRVTDMEQWIEQHGVGPGCAPFVAWIRQRLENFDFAGIESVINRFLRLQ